MTDVARKPRWNHSDYGTCECLDCRLDRAMPGMVARAVEDVVAKARAYAERRPERVDADRVAAITGLTTRTVQALSAAGKMPGAAKLGGKWTFDETRVRAWVRAMEAQAARASSRRTATGAARSSGRVSRSEASNTARAYEQALRP